MSTPPNVDQCLTNYTSRDILLLEFLRDHEAPCPLCGYNLKSLTRPRCPECGQALMLTVGIVRLRMGWLFVAVAPGFFSGIAACFVLVLIVGRLMFGDGVLSPAMTALDLFGWSSGLFAIILAAKRARFLALSPARQRWWAILIWVVHVVAMGMFVLFGLAYL